MGFADLATVGVGFEVGDELAELAAALVGQVEEEIEVTFGDVGSVVGDVELGPDFSGRGFGLTEVANELGLGVAFEAFGDVGHDGYAGPAQLVAQAEIAGEFTPVGDGVDLAGELAGGLPGADVFEAVDGGHGGKSVGTFRRWNVRSFERWNVGQWSVVYGQYYTQL